MKKPSPIELNNSPQRSSDVSAINVPRVDIATEIRLLTHAPPSMCMPDDGRRCMPSSRRNLTARRRAQAHHATARRTPSAARAYHCRAAHGSRYSHRSRTCRTRHELSFVLDPVSYTLLLLSSFCCVLF